MNSHLSAITTIPQYYTTLHITLRFIVVVSHFDKLSSWYILRQSFVVMTSFVLCLALVYLRQLLRHAQSVRV